MGVSSLNRENRENIRKGNYPTCYLCKKPIKKEYEVSQDHILPKSCNWETKPENLAVCHKVCNSRRGTTPLSMIACGCWKSGWHFNQRN